MTTDKQMVETMNTNNNQFSFEEYDFEFTVL